MSLQRVAIASPNKSSRGGSAVRLVVIHTAQGAATFRDLGAYFANPASEVSSHTGIDDTVGQCGEYVGRSDKAWTQGNANPYCVSCELCAWAEWDSAEWSRHPNMLANVAQWVAEECAHFGVPLVALSAAQAQSGAAGVCDHAALGSDGGGHWDCGPGFPMAQVISMATGGSPPHPQPPVPSPPQSAGKPPPWPYAQSDYLGQTSSDPHCHSSGSAVMTWQTQMALRGWNIEADGLYGPASATTCRQFQAEKGLSSDGLCGPITWSATWTEPIT